MVEEIGPSSRAHRAPATARLAQTCRDATASCELSKIRLVRCRNRCVLSGIVFMRVLGADDFRPITRRAQISYGGRPGHREDAIILDRELELKLFALMVGVRREGCDADILFSGPFHR